MATNCVPLCWCALFRISVALVKSIFNSRPMVTGTSVLGVTFGDGVMLAADTLGKRENLSYIYE